jgi:4-hydroxybenzoate polyprenyltransferase
MKWTAFRKLTKVEYTLFGLPFTVAGALLPFADQEATRPFLWAQWTAWLWIVLAFVSARTAGMAFNELIDRQIDAANPRTQRRVLPSGEASPKQALWIAIGAACLFFCICYQINKIVFFCSFPIIFLLWAYSYTKRFTALCHFILGAIQFFGPFLAWVTITGEPGWPPFLLGVALFTSIAANDIVYAIQDCAFDTEQRLHSIPVLLGVKNSLVVARILHGLTVVLLAFTGWMIHIHPVYYSGVVVIAGFFIYYHWMLHRQDLKKSIPQAFFACNSRVALTMMLCSLGAVLWPALL